MFSSFKLQVYYITCLSRILLTQIVPMKYNPRDENSIKAVMAKANVVINLIGRVFFSSSSFHL